MKILTTPRMERCIGCHSCSLACARLVHKRLSWDTAGIRIRSSGGLSALERINTSDLRLAELDEALQALEIAIQLKPAEGDYSSRYQRMKIERDFIAACGEAALRFEHVIVPMRLAGQTDLIAHLLTASRDALSDAVLNELDTIRTRVRERLGVQPPPVLISYLPGDDVPTGKYAISVKKEVVQEAVLEGELENAQFVQERLFQRLEDMEKKHLAVFA